MSMTDSEIATVTLVASHQYGVTRHRAFTTPGAARCVFVGFVEELMRQHGADELVDEDGVRPDPKRSRYVETLFGGQWVALETVLLENDTNERLLVQHRDERPVAQHT